ncbi:phosphodiester glycosidase family protein [Kamptonema animale CS-326]|uniref:phosphodiester glycosidase family protein n=1 Tax=Kamptonema animale TaxID=92934 RepID=UPI00232BEBA3|nr:phosphodiester glycosidase family protein [Kamptonema animale]MDB9511163.1 phosphodiester glycosidase family protein [Kamptonema animale CS-326]
MLKSLGLFTRFLVKPAIAIALCLLVNEVARGAEVRGDRGAEVRGGRGAEGEFLSSISPSPLLPISPAPSLPRSPAPPLSLYSSQKILAQSVVSPANDPNQGRQVSLNGNTFRAAWSQQPGGGNSSVRTWIADVSLMEIAGIELLNSGDATKQPVQWFSQSQTDGLATRLTPQYRYLDITDFAKKAGWQISTEGNTLKISTQPAKLTAIRVGKQEWGDRIVLDLDRPTFWRLSYVEPPPRTPTPKPKDTPDDPTKPTGRDTPDDPTKPQTPKPTPQVRTQEWLITVDAVLDRALIARTFGAGKHLQSLKVESSANQTKIRVNIPLGWRPLVFTLGNRDRLVIDIRPDSLVERDILWAPGLRWRSQYRNLGNSKFPVVWLEINPRQSGLKIRPILSNPPTDSGTAPLLQTAELSNIAAAINGGFFNRINRLALGAIRRDNQWLSGPILNRGAIAWNDNGDIKIGRLSLQESLITSKGERLAVTHLNSAYVQAGIGRYTAKWGTSYTPFSDGEIIVTVQNEQVISQSPGGTAGKTSFPIPANSYLLTLRSNPTIANQIPVGTSLRLETATVPADFNRYPYILGGGPVLVQNSQVFLDAKAEGFSDAYVKQTAIRSAVAIAANGNLLIVAIHNRAGGAGATFSNIAQIMQQMGAVDALNLDGGSSTSLYLGGQLIDRPAQTAARVHNGIGVFIQP